MTTPRDPLEAAAAYALGAVDPAEREALDARMAHDPEFRRAVEEYREVTGMLALATPLTPAPAGLRDRILADARSVRPITSAPAAAAPAPVTMRRDRTAGRIAGVLPWLAVAASLLFAIVSSNQLRTTRQALAQLRGDLVDVQAEIAGKDSVIAAFMGPEVHVVSLAEGDTKKPSARVYWNHTKQVFIVTAFNVPRAPDGRTYQLWAISNGKAPMSMGTFNTDASGRATIVVPVSRTVIDGGHIDLCGMTLEPTGGSAQPTEAPRLVGSWRHTD